MSTIEVITVPLNTLRDLIRQETTLAMNQFHANQHDELLTVTQLCERIPGLTRYIFKKLEKSSKLKNTRGKYSLKAVKDAMQSH